jgi:hypothetical protein
MFFAVQLPQRWLVSPVAQRVYLGAASCLGTFLLFLVGDVVWIAAARGGVQSARIADTIFMVLLVPGILGTSVLNVAMWYFWLRCHSNETHSKGFWLLVLWWLSPIGALFYFAFFYRKHPFVRLLAKPEAVTA